MTRQAFFVLGMHRCGTSFLAHALSKLGLKLPVSLSAGAPDNPKGHFESLRITQFHDRLLKELNLSWDSFISPPYDWFSSDASKIAECELATLLHDEFPEHDAFILKDPRLSLFLPLWQRIAEQAELEEHYIISVRHPVAVAASLADRNQISKSRSILIWLNHALSAERNTRERRRAFVCFPEWTRNFEETIAAVENHLGANLPDKSQATLASAEREFDRRFVHHQSSEGNWANDRMESMSLKAFAALQELSLDPFDPTALGNLDALRREYSEIASPFVETLAEIQRSLAAESRATSEAQLAASDERLASLERRFETRNEQVHAANAALERRLSETKLRLAELEQLLKAERTAAESLRKEHEALLVHYQTERLTVIRPIGRNIYRRAGPLLRKNLPEAWVDRIKSLVPDPDGIPKQLTYVPQPLSYPSAKQVDFAQPSSASEPDIFVLSIINWDFRYQRPQHIAKGLADCGKRVFYVEMQWAKGDIEVVVLKEGVYRIRLPMEEVGFIEPYTGRAHPEQARKWVNAFYRFCDMVKATAFKQIIIQHPYWWQMARHLSPEFQIVVDCMDDISGFSNTDPFLLNLEKDMLARSDKLIVSSQSLLEKYSEYGPSALIRNAAEIDDFSAASVGKQRCTFLEDNSPHRPNYSIRVGYVGAIAEWFDTHLVEELATMEPDFVFHLCGAVSVPEAATLSKLSNVFMHGEIRYSEVPGFLSQMDVLIIPFKIIPIIRACDPVKFYEYCAMGKPTVSTRLPELSRASPLVHFASTPQQFAQQIKQAWRKGKDLTFREELVAFAAQNTWRDRCRQFIDVLSDMPKVSTVILSYGDPELTKTALSSLFDSGLNYPNMEIIVVDNGSAATDVKLIRDFVDGWPNVSVIENGVNLGFAKGNNVGLKIASGEYVMLLNNDTAVAPGAINAMVTHLKNNPRIGAVGPLTNNIGNEAKLFVEYEDIDQMKNIARQATTGYRGVYSVIEVLGYFAVMFRRADLEVFGLLAEDYGRGMFEDDDHCAQIRRAGRVCALAEDSYVHHHLSATFSNIDQNERQQLFEINKKTYEEKWGPWKKHKYRQIRPRASL